MLVADIGLEAILALIAAFYHSFNGGASVARLLDYHWLLWLSDTRMLPWDWSISAVSRRLAVPVLL